MLAQSELHLVGVGAWRRADVGIGRKILPGCLVGIRVIQLAAIAEVDDVPLLEEAVIPLNAHGIDAHSGTDTLGIDLVRDLAKALHGRRPAGIPHEGQGLVDNFPAGGWLLTRLPSLPMSRIGVVGEFTLSRLRRLRGDNLTLHPLMLLVAVTVVLEDTLRTLTGNGFLAVVGIAGGVVLAERVSARARLVDLVTPGHGGQGAVVRRRLGWGGIPPTTCKDQNQREDQSSHCFHLSKAMSQGQRGSWETHSGSLHSCASCTGGKSGQWFRCPAPLCLYVTWRLNPRIPTFETWQIGVGGVGVGEGVGRGEGVGEGAGGGGVGAGGVGVGVGQGLTLKYPSAINPGMMLELLHDVATSI